MTKINQQNKYYTDYIKVKEFINIIENPVILNDEKQKNITQILSNLTNLPTVPKVMFDVITTLKSNPGDTIKISQVISKDQGITTKILSIANSALYGMERHVSSLEFAIMLLGSKEIERIVTAISLSEAIKIKSVPNFDYDNYWKHSMIVGLASKDIAMKLGHFDISGEAFLGGMLHDVGLQIIVKYFPQEFNEIIQLVNSGNSFLDAEQMVLGLTHQEIGRFIAQKWSLPQNLCDIIEFHHTPTESKENSKLASIVHLADSMTQEFQIGNGNWDDQISFDLSVVEQLEFGSAEELNEFTHNYRDIFKDTAEGIDL
ncbi:MAG: HDOD domain-containing protein [Melioribacteraceae bacterium]|nr:HDOD domain-containing protein [Melioribacteraceae bacterium]